MGALLRHHWLQHRLTMLPIIAAALIFELLLTRVAPAGDELSWITNFFAVLPPAIRALVGGDIAVSAQGFLSIGYNHPFLLLLIAVSAIRVPSAALAGEIGRGTMDLIGARPITRTTEVVAGLIAAMAATALVVAAAWCGTAVGLAARPLHIAPWPFLRVALVLWLLFAAFAAIGILISALRRDAGSAIAWSSGVIATSFVLEYLARLWAPIARLRPLSLFAYYRPQAIVAAGLDVVDLLMLTAVAVIASVAAIFVFSRRDLS